MSAALQPSPSPSRRLFLKSAGLVGGAWVLGLLPGAGEQAFAAGASAAATQFDPNAFISIHSDGSVTLTMPKIEMGQGTYTSLPMLLAEELEIGLEQVRLRHAPPDVALYGGARHDQFTGGSLSIQTLWLPLRQAGASARTVLVAAAAQGWNVAPESCHAAHGVVHHAASKRQIAYGALIDAAARLPLPAAPVPLKARRDFKLLGTPQKRLDTRGKVDGSAQFGIDVVLPGMLFASVAACPVAGGTLKSVDDRRARALPGVRDVVRLSDAVAVIADNTWHARQGVAALEIAWDDGPNTALSTAGIAAIMARAAARPGKVARNDGDAAGVLAAAPASQRYTSTYTNPMLAHAPMEPINCTVHVQLERAELWVGTQIPARARDAVAKRLGIAPEQVTLNGYLLGGAFGRRLHSDFIEQAALIGRQVKGPVKVTWTREEDMQHDVYRGHYHHVVSASVGEDGWPLALFHKLAGPSNIAPFSPGLLRDGLDLAAVEGSANFSYAIPGMKVEYTREDGPVPTGFWRGVGPTRNLFVLESFIDELAHRAKRDPLQYRLAMLKDKPRAAHVLERAAKLAGWGGQQKSPPGMPARTGRGIALLYAWNTYMAQVVDLSVGMDGAVTVRRVVCVVDCGSIVNPDTVAAQIQGGINFGLTAMLYGEITHQDGRVQQSNFHDYQALRMPEAPPVVIEIVDSEEPPGGIGEPGTATFGPAFANAIFAATGKRLYHSPVRAADLTWGDQA